jgi:tetratricopeptide (TPR) repeat protein
LIELLIRNKAHKKALAILESVDVKDYESFYQFVFLRNKITLFGYLNRLEAIRPEVEKFIKRIPLEERFELVNVIEDWISFTDAEANNIQCLDVLLCVLVDLIPDSPWYGMLQAKQTFRKGEFSKTKESLEKALAIASSQDDRLQILNGLGYIYLVLGDPDHASQILEEAVSLSMSENYHGPWLEWHAFLKNGKFFLEEEYSIVYAVRVNLVTSYLMEGNVQQAYEVVSGLIDADNHNMVGPACALLGYIDLGRGDKQSARIAWKIALKNGYRPDRMNAEINELDAELKKPASS